MGAARPRYRAPVLALHRTGFARALLGERSGLSPASDHPHGFPAVMWAALGLWGGCSLPAGGELLEAADCRVTADGERRPETRSKDLSLEQA
jgi:hypothetical protein